MVERCTLPGRGYRDAESSKVAYNCDGCGYEIHVGEMMGIFFGRIYCSDCIEDRVREVTDKDLPELVEHPYNGPSRTPVPTHAGGDVDVQD